jgi:hypothetical protein
MSDGSSATLAATDKFAFSDGGTEKYILASQIDTFVSGTSATLTNKTLTTPTINGVIGGTATSQTITTLSTGTIVGSDITVDASGDISLDADGGDVFFKDGGSTYGSLTNSSGNLVIKSNTTTAISMSGANVTVAGNLTVQGTTTTVDSSTINVQNSFVFEGATADAHETNLTTIDPTADRTVSIPNATGTIVLKDTTDTLTNKSIDSDNNTITNLVNADIKSAAAIAYSKMEDLTASRALVSDGSGDLGVSSITATELNALSGVDSNLQDQLDNRVVNGATQAFAIAQSIALG